MVDGHCFPEITQGFGLVALLNGQVAQITERNREIALPLCIGGIAGGEAFGDGHELREITQGFGLVALRNGQVTE